VASSNANTDIASGFMSLSPFRLARRYLAIFAGRSPAILVAIGL